jgi:hypothetical protein
MLKRTSCIVICMVAALGGPAVVLAQESPPPEIMLDLNEGIYNYLKGYLDDEEYTYYDEAIRLFTQVLDRDPDNATALLFRSLSEGQIGLFERQIRLGLETGEREIGETIDLRRDPESRTRFEEEIRDLQSKLEEGQLDSAEQLVTRFRVDKLTSLLEFDQAMRDASIDELVKMQAERITAAHSASRRERDRYRTMVRDIDRLIEVLDDPDAIIRLLEVIARSKIARLDEEEAVRILNGTIPEDQASGPPDTLRALAASILDRTAGLLEDLIERHPADEDAVRAKFFLGVIRFRQALPRQPKDEPPVVHRERLREAERIMAELLDDEDVDQTWKSYSALYLGLIIPVRAAAEPLETDRNAGFDEAERRLEQAAALDASEKLDDTGNAVSDSGGAIPLVVSRQREVIADARERPPASPAFLNDLRITIQGGLNRDTNVVLLGGRADLPRGVSRTKDFGFSLNTYIDYTLDLGHLDPDLDKWTLGLRGRISQLMHVDVDEFDEQTYGGSAAIQYELTPDTEDHGPAFAQLQYDYEYTLLGRDGFLTIHTLSPRLRWYGVDRSSESSLYFRYEDRDYSEPLFDKRFNRDGNYFTFGFFHTFRLTNMTPVFESWGVPAWGLPGDNAFGQDNPDYPDRYLTPFVGLEYAWDATRGSEFDRKALTLTLGAVAPLPWGLQFDTTMNFTYEDYYHRGSITDFHRRARRDFVQRYEVGLSRSFVMREGAPPNRYNVEIDHTVMTIRLHSTWTTDDSNVVNRLGQAIFSYDRVFYGLTVGFSFN